MGKLFMWGLNGAATVVLSFFLSTLFQSDAAGLHQDLLRYDPQNDSFTLLYSWTNIRPNTSKAATHLASIWERRDRIIPTPFHLLWHFPAIERGRNGEHQWIDLFTASKPTKFEFAEIDLDTIQIKPGEFYVNSDGGLCYYHQIVIPGITMDRALAAITPTLAEIGQDAIKYELEKTRKGKLHQLSWEECRKEMLVNLTASVSNQKPPAHAETILPLNVESISRLMDAKLQNSIVPTRKGKNVSWTVPLSAEDCRECLVTWDTYRNALRDFITQGKSIPDGMSEFLDSISLNDLDGTGLQITFELATLTKYSDAAIFGFHHEQSRPQPKPNSESTIIKLEQLGVPINRSFNADQLFLEYGEPRR